MTKCRHGTFTTNYCNRCVEQAEITELRVENETLRAALKVAQETNQKLAWSEIVDAYQAIQEERDTLKAKLSAIEKQEPAAWMRHDALDASQDFRFVEIEDFTKPLYAAHVAPAQPANDLVQLGERFEKLHASGDIWITTIAARCMVDAALASAKAAQPLTKEQVVQASQQVFSKYEAPCSFCFMRAWFRAISLRPWVCLLFIFPLSKKAVAYPLG